MAKASKPMAKDANSRFQTRNNRNEIFSKFEKKADLKVESRKVPLADEPVENGKPKD